MRILWVVDAYTTSSRYPYAERADGFGGASYVRNSVKAVVDAYDGSVTLYAIDTTDPMLRAYRKAFPSSFTDRSQLPAGLEAHFRYPEDLFKAQAAHLGRYHITNAPEFYSATDAWKREPRPGRQGRRRSGVSSHDPAAGRAGARGSRGEHDPAHVPAAATARRRA